MELTVTKNATCTFCGCVCDDIELHSDGTRITHSKAACVLVAARKSSRRSHVGEVA